MQQVTINGYDEEWMVGGSMVDFYVLYYKRNEYNFYVTVTVT